MGRLEMHPDTLAQLSKLLDSALEQEPDSRARWVDGLGAQFESLKPALHDLLSRAASIETADFLATLPKIRVDPHPSYSSANPGERVGAYRLVRELGAGGMGTVWLAERADGLFNRPVALKLPHVFAPLAGLAERMSREREILATLDHPNIARLQDAGIDGRGQPYLALDYVEGIPIDRFLREQPSSLDVAARLRLFLQVADAVAYAHGKLVLHRDLKPTNMLVTANGDVRLLDFGIAKLLDNGLTNETRLTRAAGTAMTPDYASPEQIRGEPLGVASDVYSLGVVLYELLGGERPYRLRRDSRGALEDAILKAEPAALPRPLRGDLETILKKALKKSPDDRYATVNALADDLRRYLARRPVLARPDSVGYRLRRFVARNRLAVATGATVGLAVLFSGAIAIWQARAARLEKVRAEAVKDVLIGLFDEADPYTVRGKPLSTPELLLHAADRIEKAPASDPRVRAEISNVLAYSLFRLGEDAASERLVDRSLANMRLNLPAADQQIFRAQILAAQQLRFRGKTAEARAMLEKSQPYLAELRRSAPREYLEWYMISSDVAIDAADHERAIRDAGFAYTEAPQLAGPRDRITARALVRLGVAYQFAGRDAEALATSRQALALSLQVLDGHPLAPELLDARVALAKAEAASGNLSPAIATFEEVIRAASEINGPDSLEVGIYEQNVAGLLVRAGRIKEGIQAGARAVAIRLPQVDHASFESLATRNTYARGLLAGRRARAAEETLAGMQADAAQVFGTDHVRTVELRALHALAVAWNGDLRSARRLADEALAQSRRGGEPPSALILQACAQIARLDGDAPAAARLAGEGLTILAPSSRPRDRAEMLAELGSALLQSGEQSRATAALTEAATLLDSLGGPMTPLRAEIDLALARGHHAQGQRSQAFQLARRAAVFWEDFDSTNRGGGEAAYWAWRFAGAGVAEAEAAHRRALRLLRDSAFPGDSRLFASAAAGS